MTTPTNHPTFLQPSSEHHAPNNLGDHEQLHVGGYPKLAFFFSHHTRYLHVRRFSAIAVRLLLYRQHNLTVLENNLLELEERDASSVDANRRLFCANFGLLKSPVTPLEHEQRVLYEDLKREMKEYEKAILRFDRLGAKGYGVAELRTIQWFQGQQNRYNPPLSGCDASVWGSVKYPEGYASDIIQVVEQASLSAIGKFCRDKILQWAPELPEWLWLVFFWSKKRKDAFSHYSFSGRAIEVASLALGNIVTSFLVYAAVASLYFISGKAASIAGVVVIAIIITVCSVLFRNQQFISMLATVCAVLVALLLNDSNHQGSQSTRTTIETTA